MIDPRFTGALVRAKALLPTDEIVVHAGGMAQRAALADVQAALGVTALQALVAALEARVAALETP